MAVNAADPNWKEAFLHPKQAPGIVVQLAESHEPGARPSPAVGPTAELVYVGHALADLDGGLRLFEGLLGGHRIVHGSGPGYRWVDLAWPGPGRLRLFTPDGPGPLREWLGARPGRLHHLAFSLAEPERVSSAVARDGHWLVQPSDNSGTRLVLYRGAALGSRPISF